MATDTVAVIAAWTRKLIGNAQDETEGEHWYQTFLTFDTPIPRFKSSVDVDNTITFQKTIWYYEANSLKKQRT